LFDLGQATVENGAKGAPTGNNSLSAVGRRLALASLPDPGPTWARNLRRWLLHQASKQYPKPERFLPGGSPGRSPAWHLRQPPG